MVEEADCRCSEPSNLHNILVFFFYCHVSAQKSQVLSFVSYEVPPMGSKLGTELVCLCQDV